MLGLRWAVVILTGLFTCYTAAQTATTVQGDWLAPALPDHSTTITLGDQYELHWTSHLQDWFAQYAPSATITNVALWMTPSSGSDGEFLISSSVNVNTTYSYLWTVSLTTAQLTITTDWTFRFLPANQSYTTNADQQQISSPKVTVQNSPSSASSAPTTSAAVSTSASSAASKTSASASSTSTSTSAPTASPQSSPSISGGVIAGIVIGSVATVLALGLIIFFLWKHFQHKQTSRSSESALDGGHLMDDYKYNPHQSPSSSAVTSQEQYKGPSELAGNLYR